MLSADSISIYRGNVVSAVMTGVIGIVVLRDIG